MGLLLRARAHVWLGATALALISVLPIDTAKAVSFAINGGSSSYLPSNFGAFTPTTGDGGCNCSYLVGTDGLFIGYYQNSGTGTGTSSASPFSQLMVFDSVNAAGPYGLEVQGSTGNVSIKFTYLGYEAGDTNLSQDLFSYNNNAPNGTVTFDNKTSTVGSLGSQTASLALGTGANSTLVPFNFHSIDAGTTATNGGPISIGSAIGFMIDPFNNLIAYAFFDDSGAGPDSDFDDMVVELQIQSGTGLGTPLPATLPLFVGGLGMIGLTTARKRRKARAV